MSDKEKKDRKPAQMHRERDRSQYENILPGLNAVIAYAKELSNDPLFVDIGTGSGKALKQIKEDEGVRVLGVDREEHPQVQANLGENFLEADAGSMPTIQTESVDAILAVHSIAYAEDEDLVEIIKELHRIAKPGCIMTGSALGPLAESQEMGIKQTAINIAEKLEKNGFVAVCASDSGKNATQTEDSFIAIKLQDGDDEDELRYQLQQMVNLN